MNKQAFMTILFSVFFGVLAHAQQAAITGRWETTDKDIIEFYADGPCFAAKQISTTTEKDKINNNKIVARELKSTNMKIYEGIVIDPKDNKTYRGKFIINDAGTEVNLNKMGISAF